MESCSHSPPTNSPEQRSPSPSAVSRSLLTEQDCMPDNSPVQTHPNQRPQASSLGFPEQIACSATAGAEVSASCSRSREAAQLGKPATAGGAGTADYISTLENDVLRASLCSKTEGDNSSSKSTQSTPVSAAENAGSECNPEAAAVGIARNSNTSKSELLQPNPCKEDDVQMLDLSPSQQATPPEHRQGIFSAHPAARGVAANLVTACDVAKNIPGEDASGPLRQSVMQVVAAHSAMLTCTDSVQNAAPNSPNSSSSRNCLPTVRQNAAISILQNPAVLNSTDFAQNAVSNSSNSKNSPPTVRQNAAASSPHLSAASSSTAATYTSRPAKICKLPNQIRIGRMQFTSNSKGMLCSSNPTLASLQTSSLSSHLQLVRSGLARNMLALETLIFPPQPTFEKE
ncbi:hypothetical protein AXF42_Ash011061 [Apostasia shenzhenica]|uniref:Uncharacterized protein n=1 Tax=Apostasia shenzhenica TaxID=1088818 RepID=A0A2H9ZQZ8_9ASPA|nr:hypothetical protein AXF42_Ash011061 [Apostasia shenzhenica]